MTEYAKFERFYSYCMTHSYRSRVKRVLCEQRLVFLAAGVYYRVSRYRRSTLSY